MKKILIITGIVAIIGLMIALNVMKNNASSSTTDSGNAVAKGFSFGSQKPIDVDTVIIKTSSISSSILISGTVEVVDKKTIISENAVKVTDVLVKVGDRVTKGSSLFVVDTSSLLDELESARINREIQDLQLQKIQSAKNTSSLTGAEIAVELSKLNLASAQAAYEEQLTNVEKNKILLEEGIISQSELDAVENQTEPLRQQVDIATLNLQRSESDKEQLQKSNSDSNKSLAIDVQIQLKNLESLDMNIAKLEKQLTDIQASCLAPMDGTVTELMIENGQMIMNGTVIMTLENMDHLIVKALVREYDISDLAVGQTVVVTGDALSDEAVVKGRISFISPLAVETMINGRQGTGIEVKIDILEGTVYLKPGYTADCEITTQNKENVIIASFDQFREDKDNNTYVYIVEDGKVREQKIELGVTSDFDAEVISGLKEGDEVVVNPSLTLKEGTLVNSSPMVTENTTEEGE